MIDLENPYIAEDLYWFVVDNFWDDYNEKRAAAGGLSMLEYVKLYCLSEFEEAMKEKGYK